MISVLLAEDHPVVRNGLVELLGSEPDIEIVAAVGDGAAAVAALGDHDPDIVLLDLTMPEMDGIEATRMVLEQHPDTRVVILTASADREQMLRAVDAGALGYLLKDASPAELIEGNHFFDKNFPMGDTNRNPQFLYFDILYRLVRAQ